MLLRSIAAASVTLALAAPAHGNSHSTSVVLRGYLAPRCDVSFSSSAVEVGSQTIISGLIDQDCNTDHQLSIVFSPMAAEGLDLQVSYEGRPSMVWALEGRVTFAPEPYVNALRPVQIVLSGGDAMQRTALAQSISLEVMPR